MNVQMLADFNTLFNEKLSRGVKNPTIALMVNDDTAPLVSELRACGWNVITKRNLITKRNGRATYRYEISMHPTMIPSAAQARVIVSETAKKRMIEYEARDVARARTEIRKAYDEMIKSGAGGYFSVGDLTLPKSVLDEVEALGWVVTRSTYECGPKHDVCTTTTFSIPPEEDGKLELKG